MVLNSFKMSYDCLGVARQPSVEEEEGVEKAGVNSHSKQDA